jgi:hypothetical protein
VPLPSQLESQYAYPGTGESCREIVCIRYRVASLDGFSGTDGINPCSSMLMAATHVSAECEASPEALWLIKAFSHRLTQIAQISSATP